MCNTHTQNLWLSKNMYGLFLWTSHFDKITFPSKPNWVKKFSWTTKQNKNYVCVCVCMGPDQVPSMWVEIIIKKKKKIEKTKENPKQFIFIDYHFLILRLMFRIWNTKYKSYVYVLLLLVSICTLTSNKQQKKMENEKRYFLFENNGKNNNNIDFNRISLRSL